MFSTRCCPYQFVSNCRSLSRRAEGLYFSGTIKQTELTGTYTVAGESCKFNRYSAPFRFRLGPSAREEGENFLKTWSGTLIGDKEAGAGKLGDRGEVESFSSVRFDVVGLELPSFLSFSLYALPMYPSPSTNRPATAHASRADGRNWLALTDIRKRTHCRRRACLPPAALG